MRARGRAARHLFHLHVGDWSDDGHGRHQTFLVESNRPVESVREAYFKAQKLLPEKLSPEEIFSELREFSINKEVADLALQHGYDFFSDLRTEREPDEDDYRNPQVGPEEYLEYVLWFIRQGNRQLVVRVKPIEDFTFYGHDSKGRHISYMGYGLFSPM